MGLGLQMRQTRSQVFDAVAHRVFFLLLVAVAAKKSLAMTSPQCTTKRAQARQGTYVFELLHFFAYLFVLHCAWAPSCIVCLIAPIPQWVSPQ